MFGMRWFNFLCTNLVVNQTKYVCVGKIKYLFGISDGCIRLLFDVLLNEIKIFALSWDFGLLG